MLKIQWSKTKNISDFYELDTTGKHTFMNQKSVLLRQKQQEKIKVKMLGEKRKATAIAFLTEKSLIEFVKAFIW